MEGGGDSGMEGGGIAVWRMGVVMWRGCSMEEEGVVVWRGEVA